MRTLSREEARRVYDRIGRLQDTQAFYEDRAVDLLIEHGEFASAHAVFEFGCGTGRLAFRLLSEHLPSQATYRAVDLSPKMVGLAAERLASFGSRAEVRRSDGAPPVREVSESCDRFVSTYVLDLLSEDDIVAVLREARRMLVAGGLLCLVGLTTGSGLASRLITALWSGLHRIHPVLVGGCRPLELVDWLPAEEWKILYRGRVAPFGVPSETLIAQRV